MFYFTDNNKNHAETSRNIIPPQDHPGQLSSHIYAFKLRRVPDKLCYWVKQEAFDLNKLAPRPFISIQDVIHHLLSVKTEIAVTGKGEITDQQKVLQQ